MANQHTETVIRAIEEGLVDDDLNDIYEALRNRHRVLAKRLQRASMRALLVGDRVRVSGNIKPHYMIGATGTVKEKYATKILVNFDKPMGRFKANIKGEVLVKVPASCLEEVDA